MFFTSIAKGAGRAASVQKAAYQTGIDEQRRQYEQMFPKPVAQWEDVGDFWNDPRRWDGIDNPRKVMFWGIDCGVWIPPAAEAMPLIWSEY